MPQFVATVHRTAGQITEAFEHNRDPAHWTDFDVWLVLAKMHWFISDRGNRKVPARLTRQGELTFLEIESEVGDAHVSSTVSGIPPETVEKAKRRGI